MTLRDDQTWQALGMLSQSHPWHGVPIGAEAPQVVNVYVEIVPTDTVKYELDKFSGLLKVDRPQKYSNVSPTLYGLIPQTLCGERVAEMCRLRTGRTGVVGDADPMDICVLTEKQIANGNILVHAVPIGGLRMLDGDEADDKIVAVLQGDAVYGGYEDIDDCPALMIDRLRHYFLTYKQAPDRLSPACEITHVYGREEAKDLIRRSHEDYLARFAGIGEMLRRQLASGA
jgi:inorganic pyrophosphatase